MKMLMIIIDEAKREELEVFLNRSGVVGYTEISHAAGMGQTGLRLGSSAFPRTSAVVFSILDDSALEKLIQGVDRFCSTCGEELRMVSWDVDVLR
jgi:nitrogen regulatory protein PII